MDSISSADTELNAKAFLGEGLLWGLASAVYPVFLIGLVIRGADEREAYKQAESLNLLAGHEKFQQCSEMIAHEFDLSSEDSELFLRRTLDRMNANEEICNNGFMDDIDSIERAARLAIQQEFESLQKR